MVELDHLFVVPDFAASISGGNRFNAGLLEALCKKGVRCAAVSVSSSEPARDLRYLIGESPPPATLWLDSIYFEHFETWLDQAHGMRVGALLHSLPSQLHAAASAIPIASEPSASEASTLSRFAMVMAPSRMMARQLERCARQVFVVEPARLPHAPERAKSGSVPSESVARRPLQACIVSHLLANKGVLEFLAALGKQASTGEWLLEVVGRDDLEPELAAGCHKAAHASPQLARNVHFLGGMTHPQTLDLVARSDVFVSTSPFESYGIAIAEARALGIPILARDGGNVTALVSHDSGGELCADAAQLAHSFVALAGDPARLQRRHRAAAANRLPARSWSDAADDFLRGASSTLGGTRA